MVALWCVEVCRGVSRCVEVCRGVSRCKYTLAFLVTPNLVDVCLLTSGNRVYAYSSHVLPTKGTEHVASSVYATNNIRLSPPISASAYHPITLPPCHTATHPRLSSHLGAFNTLGRRHSSSDPSLSRSSTSEATV